MESQEQMTEPPPGAWPTQHVDAMRDRDKLGRIEALCQEAIGMIGPGLHQPHESYLAGQKENARQVLAIITEGRELMAVQPVFGSVAFDEGFAAQRAGASEKDNPYPDTGPGESHDYWHSGWWHADTGYLRPPEITCEGK